jgi:hypothetical protein
MRNDFFTKSHKVRSRYSSSASTSLYRVRHSFGLSLLRHKCNVGKQCFVFQYNSHKNLAGASSSKSLRRSIYESISMIHVFWVCVHVLGLNTARKSTMIHDRTFPLLNILPWIRYMIMCSIFCLANLFYPKIFGNYLGSIDQTRDIDRTSQYREVRVSRTWMSRRAEDVLGDVLLWCEISRTQTFRQVNIYDHGKTPYPFETHRPLSRGRQNQWAHHETKMQTI